MLAAGIVQDTFAREAVEGEGGEEETTGSYLYCYSYFYFYWYFYRSGWKVFHFLALEFKSQNTHAHMRIRTRRTYIGECGSTLYVGLSGIVRNLIQKSTV